MADALLGASIIGEYRGGGGIRKARKLLGSLLVGGAVYGVGGGSEAVADLGDSPLKLKVPLTALAGCDAGWDVGEFDVVELPSRRVWSLEKSGSPVMGEKIGWNFLRNSV
jgi:hypothetical protein